MTTPQITPREIRVFLSSTFKDMEAERSHLIKNVFPKVRAACVARRVGFTEIDLRWGVTEEEAKNGATVEICLAEIDRCRDFPPFFVGFLGERYGWIPQEEELATYWARRSDSPSPYVTPIRDAVARGISVTELEMELGVLGKGAAEKLRGHALFLLRDKTLTDSLYRQETGKEPDPTDPAYYDAAAGQLEQLKSRIRQTAFLRTFDGNERYASVDQFGQAIEDYLLGQLDRHYPADAMPSLLERMQAAHAAFRYHRLQNFLPRPEVAAQVREALIRHQATPALGPVLLAGPSGQGKSALMADLARSLDGGDTHWQVIDHYIGADEHNTLDAWVEHLLLILHPEVEDLTGPVPETPKDRNEALPTWITYAARRREKPVGKPVRLLLILDALDQLADGGKDLDLLTPAVLGPDALLLCSAADGTPAREAAKAWDSLLVPPLTDALKERFVTDTLTRYCKNLLPALTTRLAHAPQAGSPLYLGLALEELRLDARHENLEPLIDDILACPDAASLFLERFLLDEDYSRPEQPDLATRFMALIGAARNGLSENELADLLALPTDPVAADSQKPRLPQVHLSRLLTVFQPYLLNKEGNRAPMHRIFGEAALDHIGEQAIREQLYAHFRPGYGQASNAFQARAATEALYQITRIAQTDPSQRPRLEDDLAFLPTPARLLEDSEDVVLKALHAFSYDEKSALAGRWAEQVTALVEAGSDGMGTVINDFSDWLAYMIGHYPAARGIQEPLLEVSRRILGTDHPDTLSVMGSLASTLNDFGDLLGAQTLGAEVLETRRRILGPEHEDTLHAMRNLASTLRSLGDLPEARTMDEKALEASRHSLGNEHPATLTSMNNLALTLGRQGDRPAARALQEQALEIRRRISGAEHPSTLTVMGNLAVTLSKQGEHQAARVIQEQVLEVSTQTFGPEHPATLCAMNNLARTLNCQNDLPGARALDEQVLVASRRVLGPEHPSTLNSMSNLALTLEDHGDLPGARALDEQVLEARQRVLGPEHPDTLTTMNNLASKLKAHGDLHAGQVLQEQVVEASRRVLGPEHPNTLTAIDNLALTLGKQGNHARKLADQGDLPAARALWEQVVTSARRYLGEEHPKTLVSMNHFARILAGQGDLSGAQALLEPVLAALRRVLGEAHPKTLQGMNNLAAVLAAHGELAQAEALRKEMLALSDEGDRPGTREEEDQVLAIRQRMLGDAHPKTLLSMHRHARTLAAQGDLPGARVLQEKVLEIRRRTLGESHADTRLAMIHLARTLTDQGDLAKAQALEVEVLALSTKGDCPETRELQEKVLAVRRRVLGEDHPKTLLSKGNLLRQDQDEHPAPVSPANRINLLNPRCSDFSAGQRKETPEDSPRDAPAEAYDELEDFSGVQEFVAEEPAVMLQDDSDHVSQPHEDESGETSAQVDLINAYIEMGDLEGARELMDSLLVVPPKEDAPEIMRAIDTVVARWGSQAGVTGAIEFRQRQWDALEKSPGATYARTLCCLRLAELHWQAGHREEALHFAERLKSGLSAAFTAESPQPPTDDDGADPLAEAEVLLAFGRELQSFEILAEAYRRKTALQAKIIESLLGMLGCIPEVMPLILSDEASGSVQPVGDSSSRM